MECHGAERTQQRERDKQEQDGNARRQRDAQTQEGHYEQVPGKHEGLAQITREPCQQAQARPTRRIRETIYFKIREKGAWRDVESLIVDHSDPSEVASVVKKYIRKGVRAFNTEAQLLGPEDCFEAATADGTNTILLIPENKLDIDDRLLDSAFTISLEMKKRREEQAVKMTSEIVQCHDLGSTAGHDTAPRWTQG